MPEYGIRLGDRVIVGPHWGSPADVIDSFHAFGVNRVYGELVVCDRVPGEVYRDPVTGVTHIPGILQHEWRLADGHV